MKVWIRALTVAAVIEAVALVLWVIPVASFVGILLLAPGIALTYGLLSHGSMELRHRLLFLAAPLVFWTGVAALALTVGGWIRRRFTHDASGDG